jgi:hypothetical protein
LVLSAEAERDAARAETETFRNAAKAAVASAEAATVKTDAEVSGVSITSTRPHGTLDGV